MTATTQINPAPTGEPSKIAEEAAQFEIAANYLRGQKLHKQAPIGFFVQKAIDKVLEDYRNATARG